MAKACVVEVEDNNSDDANLGIRIVFVFHLRAGEFQKKGCENFLARGTYVSGFVCPLSAVPRNGW
jgi:hypothetical protein